MNRTWWKESVVYQIYPRSFADSNGDGIGDLCGIISKLDYLQTLGVNVVWLSPVYKSPNDDNGYDISDYQAINPEFGTLDDWQELVDSMHRRGIKLVMDLVVNHTSDEHPWFQQSRASKENPYRDYYIWRPAKNGHEPNNWASFFGGSAWQFDETTGEYYLHLFSKRQPDLNWDNPKVRAEIFSMMRWWLDKGVDGFRMDVINAISKVEGLPDAPIGSADDSYHFGGVHFLNGPRFMDYLREMKEQVLDKYDILTVGETPLVTTADAIQFTNQATGVLNMLFQFEHMTIDAAPGADSRKSIGPWKLSDLKSIMTRWQKDLEGRGWNSIYLANHDQPRPVSRFANDKEYRVESAKMLATFIHMLQGTPYVYQGEEIGMTNVSFDTIDEYRDIETLNNYQELTAKGMPHDEVMKILHAKSRDNARTPMQWDDSPEAGFTTGAPWIQANPNYKTINVAASLADPNSVFHYYQKLIQLRKQNPVMVYGTYDLILADHPEIYAFTRTLGDERWLVILNFMRHTPEFVMPADIKFSASGLLIGNYEVDTGQAVRTFTLRPYEARVYRLSA